MYAWSMKTQAVAVVAGRRCCRGGLGGLQHAAIKRGAEHGGVSALPEPSCVTCHGTDMQPLLEQDSNPALFYGFDVGWWPHMSLKSAPRL